MITKKTLAKIARVYGIDPELLCENPVYKFMAKRERIACRKLVIAIDRALLKKIDENNREALEIIRQGMGILWGDPKVSAPKGILRNKKVT